MVALVQITAAIIRKRIIAGSTEFAARFPVHAAGVARRPRARGRTLGRVVDEAGSAVRVSDRRGPHAVAVLVAAGRLDTQQQHDDRVLGVK